MITSTITISGAVVWHFVYSWSKPSILKMDGCMDWYVCLTGRSALLPFFVSRFLSGKMVKEAYYLVVYVVLD